MIIKWSLIAYGCLLLLGAFLGWRAGSKISLISGIVSGLLIFLGIYFIKHNEPAAYVLLSLVSGLLSIVFFVRFKKTHKFMPSGFLLLVSLIALGLCLSGIF